MDELPKTDTTERSAKPQCSPDERSDIGDEALILAYKSVDEGAVF